MTGGREKWKSQKRDQKHRQISIFNDKIWRTGGDAPPVRQTLYFADFFGFFHFFDFAPVIVKSKIRRYFLQMESRLQRSNARAKYFGT